MSTIEGVGDEVLQFCGILLVLFFGLVAWWSTGIRDLPQIRTVLILERRSQNVRAQQPGVLSQHVTSINTGQGDQSACNLSSSRREDNNKEIGIQDNIPLTRSVPDASASEPVFRSEDSRSANANETEQGEMQDSLSDNTNEEAVSDNIRIRLKYLNDDQKLVEGRLQELLGDFKRRHFSMELSARKLVRLIFKGQVLQQDDQTLQRCGLYDNCVVHCLVHPQQNTQRPANQHQFNSPPPDWNLSLLLYACLSIILGLAWICRFNYSHLFNLTTTTALVTLTVIFLVSVIGVYMPEPTPNNS